ncbi:MAG: MFS transporter [Tepidisphaerales bacterium]
MSSDVEVEPAADAGAQPVTAAPARLDRRYVTAALMLVMVLASMEQTITSTAMPTIIGELHGLQHYAWVAAIYLLACTVSMPLYGRLADALGRKRVIVFAITVFAAASVLAAWSHSMTQLIVYRGLQGLGAGGIMPVVLTILGDIFTLQERAKIQGLFSAIWGTASLAGPALGAFLVKSFGWRSVFFVNLPLAVLGLGVLMWKYHDTEKPHSTDLDLPGVVSLSAGCMAVLALVSGLGPDGWSWMWIGVLTAASIAGAVFFIRHELRAANPILPPALMMKRTIGPPILAGFLFGVGFLSLDTYVPLYVQAARGGGVTAAAGAVTPVMLMWALSSMVAAPLLVRWGFRKTALVGAGFIVVGFTGLLLCAVAGAPHWAITAVLAVSGMGFGPAAMSCLLAAQGAVTWQQRGIITSAVAFFRTIGGSLGIGVLGAMFNVLTGPGLDKLKAAGATPAKLLDPQLVAGLPADVLHEAQGVISGGLIWVFAAMVVVAAAQMIVTTLMPAGKADHAVKASEGMEAMG